MQYKMLSIKPIVERLGALLFDKNGAALIPKRYYNRMRTKLGYFGHRKNKLYHVQDSKGAIFLGAYENGENVSTTGASPLDTRQVHNGRSEPAGNPRTRTQERPGPERKQSKRAKSKQTAEILPLKPKTERQPAFEVAEDSPPDDRKRAKYEWHLILNH